MTRLTECHGHIMMDGADYRAAKSRHRNGADRDRLREVFSMLSESGVSYFREGGDPLGVCEVARGIAPEYGIEYVSPCFAIHKKGRYGSLAGRPYEDMKDYVRLIEELKRKKADHVKLIVSGIMTFREYGELSCESVEPDEIKELIHIARSEGFPVMVHANGKKTVEACADAQSVEHGYLCDMETLDMLASSGTVWVPTLAAVDAFCGREGFGRGTAQLTLERQKEMLLLAEAKGVQIACGSDSGAYGVPHGAGTVKEMELLLSAGLSSETVEKGNRRIMELFPCRTV